MSSFHSPVDLIVFGKKRTETDAYKELNQKLSHLEYALHAQTKAIREINFHQPLLGVPDADLKNEDSHDQGGQQMELVDEEEDEEFSESETQPSSDEDAFVEVASSDGSVRSQSF